MPTPQMTGSTAPAPPWSEEGFIQRAGMRVHYAALGEGPAVVLLPKVGGWIADWRHVAPALSRHFRVIAIDLPGHGGSTVEGPPPVVQSLLESAAVITGALNMIGVARFGLAGNSVGGHVGMVMAATCPDRVTGLALLSVALQTARPLEVLLDEAASSGTYTADNKPLERSFEETSKMFHFTDRSIHEEQNASRAKAGPWVLPTYLGVGYSGVTSYLPRISAATLLMFGERGGYQHYRDLGLQALPNGKAVDVPNAGSFMHQDNPAKTADALLDFFGDLPD